MLAPDCGLPLRLSKTVKLGANSTASADIQQINNPEQAGIQQHSMPNLFYKFTEVLLFFLSGAPTIT